MNLLNKKVAIVYDRVNKFGGAERVLLTLHEMFPDAPLYTSVYNKENARWAEVFPKIYTSFIQNIPILKKHHELLGWLMPMAFEQFNFDNYDLIISVTSEAAKGIVTGTKTLHVCYCLTPTRYLWSGEKFYLEHPPKIFKLFPFYKIVSWPFLTYARWWDKVAAFRPDKYIAISTEVKNRIKKFYGVDSEIVFPPVDFNGSYKIDDGAKRNYYFIHGRFEPYKRLDLVIDAFKELNQDLIVSGSGSEFDVFKYKNYKNIKFIEKPTDNELAKLYLHAKAFIMPQEEDFGITSLEAQCFGTPVIAFGKGGSLDTVLDGKTGVLFNDQTKQSLIDTIKRFDTISFDRRYLITNAKKFAANNFKSSFLKLLSDYIDKVNFK